MKHFNRFSLAMLPLLSVLAISPSVMETHNSGRTIASLEKFEIQKSKFEVPEQKIVVDELKIDIPKVKIDLQVEQAHVIERQKVEIPNIELDIDPVVVDIPKPDIKVNIDPAFVIEREKIDLSDTKIKIDDIKLDIPKIKLSEDLVLTSDAEGKKKKDKKVTSNKVNKDSKDDEVCEKDEKIKALTAQVESLVVDQNQIMQNLLNMSQMMMMQSMMMQQQMMMSQMNTMGTQTSPYQYANQTTAGNWVYHPQGFQPSQPNIFAPAQQMSRAPGGGFYPDQAHVQQQPSWNLQPGTFGGYDLGTQGFNMGGFGIM